MKLGYAPWGNSITNLLKLLKDKVDLLVYTEKEFDKMKDEKNPLILEIISSGISILN